MNFRNLLKGLFLIVLFTVARPLVSHATEYFVDQSNPAANDQNAGTEAQPWQTIARANQTLVPGDTVYIKAGTYSSYIEPVNSGTATNVITYKNYGTDSVTISNADYGIHLNGKSFIVVNGINFTNLDKFLWLENSSNHNVISNSSFKQGRKVGWSGSKIYKSSSYNWVHDCTFSDYGYYTTTNPSGNNIGTVLDIGNEFDTGDASNYNLIENNSMYHGGHHVIGVMGMYTIVRNNYFHNEVWQNGFGDRVVYVNGYAANTGHNLIEGNTIAYSAHPPDQWGGAGLSLDNSNNIIRRNRFYDNNLAGITLTTSPGYQTSPTYNKIYNNTFFNNALDQDPNAGQELMAGIGFANYGGPGPVAHNAIKNNILRSNPKAYGISNAALTDQIVAANWEEAGDPMFINAATTYDPTNTTVPDLHLQPGSPCIDRGTALAQIMSPSGSGTTFQVDDAGYFMDGWGIVQGDTIQLAGTTQTAVITKVDYGTNTITVNAPLTWAQNQGVSLPFQGAAPDMGAFEYQAS